MPCDENRAVQFIFTEFFEEFRDNLASRHLFRIFKMMLLGDGLRFLVGFHLGEVFAQPAQNTFLHADSVPWRSQIESLALELQLHRAVELLTEERPPDFPSAPSCHYNLRTLRKVRYL